MKLSHLFGVSALAGICFVVPALAQSDQSEMQQPNSTTGAGDQFGSDTDSRYDGGSGPDWRGGPGWRGGPRPGWMMRNRDEFARWHHRWGPPGEFMRSRFGGARFTLRRGDARIDIQCPQNDSLQNCINAANQLIDKVAGMAGAAGSTSGGAGGGGGGTSPQPGGQGTPGQRM